MFEPFGVLRKCASSSIFIRERSNIGKDMYNRSAYSYRHGKILQIALLSIG